MVFQDYEFEVIEDDPAENARIKEECDRVVQEALAKLEEIVGKINNAMERDEEEACDS